MQQRVERFVLAAYAAGRSLREIAGVTDRSHSRCGTSSTSTASAVGSAALGTSAGSRRLDGFGNWVSANRGVKPLPEVAARLPPGG
jgi:hypothetical protein